MTPPEKRIHGRGARIRPPNRFESVRLESDEAPAGADACEFESLPQYDRASGQLLGKARRGIATQFVPDETQSILAENDSPDVGFRFSVNPYRGCEHGCAYCYARPTHEWLGFDAGLDFESKILVKFRAPELLRAALARPQWRPEVIVFSGNTDCYQPAERRFELTRRCLQVALAARQPISIISKNALVLRDLDVLREMAALHLAHVNLSVTTLDSELARRMEPRTSSPQARLNAITALRDAGIPVRVLLAPVIPGLNDQEIPGILKAVQAAGAQAASYVLLRLPLSVEPVFRDWLQTHHLLKQERIESLVRATRSGRYYQAEFGQRMTGKGNYARQIGDTFRLFARKYGLDGKLRPELDCTRFQRPSAVPGQKELF